MCGYNFKSFSIYSFMFSKCIILKSFYFRKFQNIQQRKQSNKHRGPIIQLRQFSTPGRSYFIFTSPYLLFYLEINPKCHITSFIFPYVSLEKWVSLFLKHSYNVIITPKNKTPEYFLNILKQPNSFYELGSKNKYTCHWLLQLLNLSLFNKTLYSGNFQTYSKQAE